MMTMMMMRWTLYLPFLFGCLVSSSAFQAKAATKIQPPSSHAYHDEARRSFMSTLATSVGAILVSPTVANAGIDPALLKNLPVQGDESGSAQRLRQIEAIQRPTSDLVDIPFQELPSGVSYREYREGKGDAVIQKGSKVAAELTIRCKSFSTQDEPGGIKYFSTKEDTEFNEIAWTIGSGEILPGLEEAMMGMRRYVEESFRETPTPKSFAIANKHNCRCPTQ
jgi:hypothetical protein